MSEELKAKDKIIMYDIIDELKEVAAMNDLCVKVIIWGDTIVADKTIGKIGGNESSAISIGMCLGTTIYCFGVVFILRLGSFYASGVTGISQLLAEIINSLFEVDLSYLMSAFIGLINIPLFLIGWKGVSKKFAVLSLSSVILQVLLNTLFQYIYNKFGSPFDILKENRLLLAILGGLLNGVGMGIALRCGSSTGGMDIVSQYLSFKKKTPFTKISFTINFKFLSKHLKFYQSI